MLGLRAENDRKLADPLRYQGAFRKTSKFANALRGRFFVSGVSGSFQKYDKTGKEIVPKPPKPPKYNYQPVIEKNQRQELMDEAQKLIELEETLAEIQRLKEARRDRDRQRRKRKLEYSSALAVQTMFRNFRKRKYGGAVNVILNFLKAMAAKQAICTAVWAVSVLKRFASSTSERWLERQRLRRQVRLAAEECWAGVRDVACVLTAARRSVAEECVQSVLAIGVCTVGNSIAAERAAQEAASPKQRLKNFVKGPKFRSASLFANQYLQFFLTEFDRDPDETSQFSMDELSEISNHFSGLAGPAGAAGATPMLRQNSRYWNMINGQPEGKKKTYNYEDAKVKALLVKHIQNMARMEAERRRRVQLLEATPAKAVEVKKPREDGDSKASRQKRKDEFLRRLEEEKLQKAKMVQRLAAKRQEARRARQAELDQQLAEQACMEREDHRLQERRAREDEEARRQRQLAVQEATRRRKEQQAAAAAAHPQSQSQSVPAVFGKRDPVPRLAGKPRAAAAEAEKEPEKPARKVLSAEELLAHREALQQRLRDQERKRASEKRAKEAEERMKKEKLLQVMEAHRLALEQAKEERRLKRRQEREQRRGAAKLATGEATGGEEEEEEEGEVGDEVRHAISSAREEFAEDHQLEDFGFEDFMDGTPQVVYSHPAPEAEDCDAPEGQGAEPGAAEVEEEEKEKGAEVQVVVDAPPARKPVTRKPVPKAIKKKLKKKLQEKEREREEKKALPLPAFTKKLPQALKDTPYFQHYVKLTAAGLTSIHDLSKKEFLDLADSRSHAPAAAAAAQHAREDPHPPHAGGGGGGGGGGRASLHQGEDSDEDGEEELSIEDLEAMLERARKSLQAPPQPTQPANHPMQASALPRDEEPLSAPRAADTEAETVLPATTSTPQLELTLDRVLNFHQYRAPPSLPLPPSVAHIPLLASLQSFQPTALAQTKPKPSAKPKPKPRLLPSEPALKKIPAPKQVSTKREALRRSEAGRYDREVGDRELDLTDSDEEPPRAGPRPPHLLGGKAKASAPGVSAKALQSAKPQALAESASKIRQKLARFQDYEAKLQADYEALRSQFQAKLETVANQFQLPRQSEEPNSSPTEAEALSLSAGTPGADVERPDLLKQYLSRSAEISTREICSALLEDEEHGMREEEEEGEEEEEERMEKVARWNATIAEGKESEEEEEEEEDRNEECEESDEGEEEEAWADARKQARGAEMNDDLCAALLQSLGSKLRA